MLHLLADGCKRNILVARIHKLAMYLVAHHQYVVTDADISQLLQLFTSPHSASWVMRVAEQQQFGFRVSCFALQILKVHCIGMVFVEQLVLYYLTSIVANGGEEAVIDGRLHNYLVARLGERLDDN